MPLRIPRNRIFSPSLSEPRFEDEQTFAESRVNGGMVTSIDAADIELTQLSDLKNAYVRYDLTSRRYGNINYTVAKPDSNRILLITPFVRFTNVVNIMRFTPSTVYLGTASTWNAVVGTLSGGANDRFNTVVINDRFFFANNGANFVQELNTGALTHARIGNAPQYKYLTGFNNRLIGANLGGGSPNPIQVGWSGDSNFGEWNPAVDFSAGSTPLTESPSDYADFINGIFGFSDNLLVLRERSLWGATKQPIATSPFNFFVIAPGIGCDSPHTAVQVPLGICWFDLRTGSVYKYTVNTPAPLAIGRPVEKTLIPQVTNINLLFANYNTIEDEYTLCIPSDVTSVVKMWTFNFRTEAWSYEEMDNVSALANIDYATSTLAIDDLIGTIDSLAPTIDLLSNTVAVASRFYGKTNGDLLIQDKTADADAGVAYTSTIASKTFFFPSDDINVTKVRIEYIPRKAGSFLAQYSKDSGLTWVDYKTITFVGGDVGKRKLATFVKNIKCRQFSWRITGTTGLYDIIEYEVKTVKAGQSKS